MADSTERGSAKLWARMFEKDAPSHEELTKAIAKAGESYRVLRWWKYGQPAIDRIKATLDTRLANAGEVMQGFVAMHGRDVQVSLDAFPYGIPDPDGVRIDVRLERQVRQ